MGTVLPFDQAKKRTYKHLYRPFLKNKVTPLPETRDFGSNEADCMVCIHRIARGDRENSFSIMDVCRESPLPNEKDPDDGQVKPVRYSSTGSRRFLMSLEEPYGYCGDKIRGGRCRDFKSIRKRAHL